MSSSLSWKEWLAIIFVNVVVSACTTWLVVRMLTNQPTAAVVEPAVAAATQPTAIPNRPSPAATPTSTPSARAAQPTPTPATAAERPTNTPPAQEQSPANRPASGSAETIRIAGVTFPGQRTRELVTLLNEGGDTAALQGWVLQSSRGLSYTLPNVSLLKDAFVNIYTTNGFNTATDIFMNRSEAAYQPGDVLTLSKGGQQIARFEVK